MNRSPPHPRLCVAGYSVNLFREDRVHTGYHVVQLEVSDQQDNTAWHNLTVLVCECGAFDSGSMPSCLDRQRSSSIGFRGAAPILFIAILLLLGKKKRRSERGLLHYCASRLADVMLMFAVWLLLLLLLLLLCSLRYIAFVTSTIVQERGYAHTRRRDGTEPDSLKHGAPGKRLQGYNT